MSVRYPSANVKKGIWISKSGDLEEESETVLHIKDQFSQRHQDNSMGRLKVFSVSAAGS